MKYYYMANFEFNPAYIGAGAGLGLAAGVLSAGWLKDYEDGNAGDWRNKMLTNAAIGLGVGALGGAGAGLLIKSNKLAKYKPPSTPQNPYNMEIPKNITPKPPEPLPPKFEIGQDKETYQKEVENYLKTKPGYLTQKQYEQNLNDPNYIWEF